MQCDFLVFIINAKYKTESVLYLRPPIIYRPMRQAFGTGEMVVGVADENPAKECVCPQSVVSIIQSEAGRSRLFFRDKPNEWLYGE